MSLTERQELILRLVVEGYVEQGEPVGSRWIADQSQIRCGSSTVRAELAGLERLGLLEHPHTSAGRVPTDAAYRAYVDRLVSSDGSPVAKVSLDLGAVRREVDGAMEHVASMLARVTELVAVVSAPAFQAAQVRHIEILALQPSVVAVVIITSSGGVSRRIFSFSKAVDQGLVEWAGSYFSERLVGMELGARRIRSLLEDPDLGKAERKFATTLSSAFTEHEEVAQESLYVEGASHLLDSGRIEGVSEVNSLMHALEERYSLLALLRSAIGEREPYLRIGEEIGAPELGSLALVAANYGLGHRNLGTVSVIGPTRMNYALAIGSVREAAAALSEVVEDVYR